MNIRKYNPEKDQKAAHRIWYEVGWVSDDKEEKAMDKFLSGGNVLVTDLNGEPECLVASCPGTIRHLEEDLSLCAVTAVTTSRIARKQGLAGKMTAQLLAEGVADGAQVAGLGMFEQGFYNRLGFGTGGYENWISFDPAILKVNVKARVPQRLTKEDGAKMLAAMLNRKRGHGACNLHPVELMEGELLWEEKAFGLGYADGPDGELTHFFWGDSKGEHGPLSIWMLAFQTWEQFLELMAVLKGLADQVSLVKMREPAGIQLQDLLRQPFSLRRITEKSKYENTMRATAYWQMRICDLPGCLAKTHLPGETVRFNLKLHDPVENYLPADAPWRGESGDYVVTLGAESSAEAGNDPTLPTLTASIGAFTRMWLGVRPASGLAVTDELSGSADLLAALDQSLRVPAPKPGWDF